MTQEKRKLLVIENDMTMDFENRHEAVGNFIEKWKAQHETTKDNITYLTNAKHASETDIVGKIMNTDDIALQTAFVNGSELQLIQFAMVLAGINATKNIYIFYGDGIGSKIVEHLSDEDIYNVKHHKIYKLGYFGDVEKIDFGGIIKGYEVKLKAIQKQKKWEKQYKADAVNRQTGTQVKVLTCTAGFDVPIGQVVDVLDMLDMDNEPHLGVWIAGKEEPVKLVNLRGIHEYEVVPKTFDFEELVTCVFGVFGLNGEHMKYKYYQVIDLLENRNKNPNVDTDICDVLEFPRRGYRHKLTNVLYNFDQNRGKANT